MVLWSNWVNHFLLVKLFNESSSNRSTDLEFLTKNGSGDAEQFGDILSHSLELLLVEEDGVVKLFLDLDLSP